MITTRKLPCIINDTDKIRLANKLGAIQEELQPIEEAVLKLKEELKGSKEQAAGLRLEQYQINKCLAEGKEERDVECKVLLNDPKQGRKRIIRIDTGELVTEEPMTLEERQGKLFEDDSPERTN